jgi:hypothetical protein
MPSTKRHRELDWLGPIILYGPRHRGATVTARIDAGPRAPRAPRPIGTSSASSSTAPVAQSARREQQAKQQAKQPLWQPQWKWIPIGQGNSEFCFCTKWFWRTLATARPSTAGMSAAQAAAAAAAWQQGQEEQGIVNGQQYGRWEQNHEGKRRWQRGQLESTKPR